MRTKFTNFVLILLALSMGLTACSVHQGSRQDLADRLAKANAFSERKIPAAPFVLTAREKMSGSGETVHIYIEGDGFAWLSKREVSKDPTPKNPVALRLAAQDPFLDVIYLARPCQYSGMLDQSERCHFSYWTHKRFAPEVIKAYHAALDDIKARYNTKHFHLIGFSGGAAIAAILAAERSDVLTLRSVAGNLDHHAHSALHKVSSLEGSVNPPEFAQRLSLIPQVHFIGAEDENITGEILESYLRVFPTRKCVQSKIIPDTDHTEGWEELWPALLNQQPVCTENF